MVAYDLIGIDDLVLLDFSGTLTRRRRFELSIDEPAERFGTNDVHRAPDKSWSSPTSVAFRLRERNTPPRSQ
jgi:hypothetical protein